jgi:hypothetical protein
MKNTKREPKRFTSFTEAVAHVAEKWGITHEQAIKVVEDIGLNIGGAIWLNV